MLNFYKKLNFFNMLFGMHAIKHLCLQCDLKLNTKKANSYEND